MQTLSDQLESVKQELMLEKQKCRLLEQNTSSANQSEGTPVCNFALLSSIPTCTAPHPHTLTLTPTLPLLHTHTHFPCEAVGTKNSDGEGESGRVLAERLATLEMRELNERQRADLAVTRYRQTKEAMSHLEERNTELEERVSELSRKLLESQAKEGELSDRLAGEEVVLLFSPFPPFPPLSFSFSSFSLTLCSPLSNFTAFLTPSPFVILLSPPFSPLSFTLPSLLPLSLTLQPSVSPPPWCLLKVCFSPPPGCLTLAEKESLETRVQELKTSETKLKLENAQLKEVAEVARQQSVAMEMWQKSRDLEMSSLRHQLLDLQMQSDEKTVAGKLHHQIVTLEISEATALKKVEEANSKVCIRVTFPPSSLITSLALSHLFSLTIGTLTVVPSR